jgi:outer membrane protein OmpA-like peptidoglycan-associated protein
LGEGRLIFGFQGAWYQQQKYFLGGPNVDANILTGIGALSLGLNRHVDAFASMAGFGSTDYNDNHASGLGSIGGGLQGTLPFEPSTPIRMAAQVGIYQGLSNNAINSNHADGYNYFETRTGLDFMAKLIQTMVVGKESRAFKIHFNEGLVTSAEANTDALLLLAAGAQFNLSAFAFGIEGNSRTPIKEINFASDPLWITPSIQFRTVYDINVTLGGDIAISQDRTGNSDRALEPFRLFAGMAFSFDTEENKRRIAKAKASREAMEKSQLRSDNRDLANDLVEQSQENSNAQMRQRERADSLAAAQELKSHQDSVIMADRARQDSLALLDSHNKLAEERAKRSDAEKQLLSTGLLLMDAVYFQTNKTDISINSKPYLHIIAKMLTKYPKLQIEIAGHTDNTGSDEHNNALSQGRAQSVVAYIIQMVPELKAVLTAKGYGETQPKADNKTSDGRKMNRRTELQVLNKDVLKEYNP